MIALLNPNCLRVAAADRPETPAPMMMMFVSRAVLSSMRDGSGGNSGHK